MVSTVFICQSKIFHTCLTGSRCLKGVHIWFTALSYFCSNQWVIIHASWTGLLKSWKNHTCFVIASRAQVFPLIGHQSARLEAIFKKKNPTCKEMEQPFKARCRTTAYNMISSLSPLLCLCCSRCPPEAVFFLSLMFPSFADITVSTRRLAEWTKITRSPSASGPVHQITSKQPSWVKMDVRVF